MQDFRNRKPLEAFGIDITYLKYNNRFAYVCSMIDVKTSEIVSYGISDNLKQDFVLGTVEYAIRNISRLRTSTIMIENNRTKIK